MIAAAGWYHVSVKTMGRSAGRSVVAAAAYRLGERLHEEQIDATHDYRRRSGVAGTFTCAPAAAPDWAHDPERLWNAANAAEKRKNSTLAREVELALPAAVSAEAREGIAWDFAQHLVERYGVAVSGAIHAPGREGDPRNHHAHIMFTTREMTPEGLGTKTRVLDSKATGPQEIAYLRGYACDLINTALEEAGSDERVDHRSFAARGIDAEPSEHLGPSASAMERRGEVSERGDLNRETEARNRQWTEDQAERVALDAQLADAEPQPNAPVPAAPGGLLDRVRRTLAGWFGSGAPASPEGDPTVIPENIPNTAAGPQAGQTAAEPALGPPKAAGQPEAVRNGGFSRAEGEAQRLQPQAHEATEPTSTPGRSRIGERFAALRDEMLSRIEARMRLTRRALAGDGDSPVWSQREPEPPEGESAFERLQREAQARAEANMIREAREEARDPGASGRRYQAWSQQHHASLAAWDAHSPGRGQGRTQDDGQEPEP